MKHGSGMWRGLRNESYLGEWKFGKTDGYGVHIWINGIHFKIINFQLIIYILKFTFLNVKYYNYQAIGMKDSLKAA